MVLVRIHRSPPEAYPELVYEEGPAMRIHQLPAEAYPEYTEEDLIRHASPPPSSLTTLPETTNSPQDVFSSLFFEHEDIQGENNILDYEKPDQCYFCDQSFRTTVLSDDLVELLRKSLKVSSPVDRPGNPLAREIMEGREAERELICRQHKKEIEDWPWPIPDFQQIPRRMAAKYARLAEIASKIESSPMWVHFTAEMKKNGGEVPRYMKTDVRPNEARFHGCG